MNIFFRGVNMVGGGTVGVVATGVLMGIFNESWLWLALVAALSAYASAVAHEGYENNRYIPTHKRIKGKETYSEHLERWRDTPEYGCRFCPDDHLSIYRGLRKDYYGKSSNLG